MNLEGLQFVVAIGSLVVFGINAGLAGYNISNQNYGPAVSSILVCFLMLTTMIQALLFRVAQALERIETKLDKLKK